MLRAQTWAEWFKQKKTQKKYLIQQIAAMQVHLDYARKGYGIIKDGTALIGDIKSGDFNLHKDYFNSLKTANPDITGLDQVQDIIKMNSALEKNRLAIIKLVRELKVFNKEEVESINNLYLHIASEAARDMLELKLLTENDKLELSDDQRLIRLEKLYRRVKTNYGFQLQTSTRIKALAESRKAQLKEAESLKRLYGID